MSSLVPLGVPSVIHGSMPSGPLPANTAIPAFKTAMASGRSFVARLVPSEISTVVVRVTPIETGSLGADTESINLDTSSASVRCAGAMTCGEMNTAFAEFAVSQ